MKNAVADESRCTTCDEQGGHDEHNDGDVRVYVSKLHRSY